MHRILISGARGQLGTDCLRVWAGQPGITGFDLPELDITDRSGCLNLLDEYRPEVLINCAAYTAVDGCESDRTCWKVNAEAPGLLAEWVERNGAFLIHVSTDYVFSGDRPLFERWRESDPTGPVSEYGKSKLAGEQAIAEKTERYAILRTAWLYGAVGKNFLKTMLRLTLQHPDRPVKVVNDQYGSPTWSHTLARQIRCVAEQQPTGVFHATSEGYCSWYHLACEFLNQMQVEHHIVPCTTQEYPTPAKRPANSILENARLKAAGISCFADWKDELADFVKDCGAAVLAEARRQ